MTVVAGQPALDEGGLGAIAELVAGWARKTPDATAISDVEGPGHVVPGRHVTVEHRLERDRLDLRPGREKLGERPVGGRTVAVRPPYAHGVAGVVDAEFRRVLVETRADAVRWGFVGSPTILVNDVDPFASEGDVPSLACRVYETPLGRSGSPTVDQFVDMFVRVGTSTTP